MSYIIRQDDISVLPLSVRTQNCLHRAGIHTIGEVMDYPPDEFINIRNMGKKSIEEICSLIQAMNDRTGEYVLLEDTESIFDKTISTQKTEDSEDSVMVLLDEAGVIVQDVPVKKLQLSVRAKNSLVHNGYGFASQLVGVTYEELLKLQNMGKKTAEEVIAYIQKISVSHRDCVEVSKSLAWDNDLAAEMCIAYGDAESVWLREILNIKKEFPDAIGETLIYRLYDSVFVRRAVKTIIIKIIEQNDNEISKVNLEEHLPQHLNNTMILEEILLELETVSAIEMGEVMICRRYPSVVEFAAQIEDERVRDVIQGRIAGKTLNEIGEQHGITRERVRQLMKRGLREKPHLREDKYIYIFEHYDVSCEDLALAYDEPSETYHYLEMISETKRAKKKPLEEMLADTLIALEYRKKAERAIYKHYISVDGMRVKMTRSDLVKHFVKNYCKELTVYDVFFQKYHEWLEELGIGDNPTLLIESRTYENKLNQCNYVLWSQWGSFRYYNISEHDFEELLSTLNLEQYENTEFSTLKLFRDYPDLMQQYDVHDEYELHNLLKKIWGSENDNVKFKKMPTIEVGSAEPENQVMELLLQYAPVTVDELANHYEEEYGVKAMTVKGNLLRVLDHYYYQGVYSVDFAALPSIQFNRMKTILDGDFYTLQEVKRLYKREFPHSDESLINPYTLKTLDFRVYSGYIVKSAYPNASDYFRYLLTTDDIVDARNISRSIQSIVAYTSELYRLRANYEIVEFSPLQYINIRRLNAVGVTRKNFDNYCKAVARNYAKGEYFTITSLRRDGFVDEIDDLGFDEWFYASVLLEDRALFSYQRIGGTRIFLRGKIGANLGEMLVWLLEKYQRIDFYELKDLLEEHYGIVLPKEKIQEFINSTELYYDKIMEAVYIDYNTYFEEI